MGSHVIDSLLFKDFYGTEQLRKVFDDFNLIQKWLDVEAALAKAEAKCGVIPKESADEICSKAKVELVNVERIKEGINKTGHPIVPLIRELANICDNDHGQYVHWGATTQDIMDTAMIMQVEEAYRIICNRLEQLVEELKKASLEHRDLVIAGRTHGQHALPVTLGFKFAVWTAEMKRNRERLDELKKRLLVGQFSGAVGTLASLGEIGLAVQKEMMDELGLFVPEITWHTARDNLAEFTSCLGIISSSVTKIANEIISLQKTEFSELEEPFMEGKVGSSTMPHKRNPMICENVVALAKIIRHQVTLALDTMIGEHERDMRGWQAEWEYIAEVCIMSDALLQKIIYIVKYLMVKPENIENNLYLLKGMILSEAIMFEIAKKIGLQRAHEVVYQASMEAYEKDFYVADVLLKQQVITENFKREEIQELLDPKNYTGLAAYFVDKVTSEQNRE